MSRQDLRLEIQDFIYEYKFQIEKYICANIMQDDHVICDDCGHEIYVGYQDYNVSELADDIMKIIHDDHYSAEQLSYLIAAGDLARVILNKVPASPSTKNHQQFDGAMKGLG